MGHLAADCRTTTGTGTADLICLCCHRRGHRTESCRFRSQDEASTSVHTQNRTAGQWQNCEVREQDKTEAAVVCSAIYEREEERSILRVPSFQPLTLTPSELAGRQREDPSLRGCYQQVGTEWIRNGTMYEFQIINGLLYRSRQFNSGREVMQLVLPQDLRMPILALAHENVIPGHRGIGQTIRRIAEDLFWPCMQSDAGNT